MLLCTEVGSPLKVEEMAYDMILVPGCETLRATTLERLEGFAKAGGKLVFVGDYIPVKQLHLNVTKSIPSHP